MLMWTNYDVLQSISFFFFEECGPLFDFVVSFSVVYVIVCVYLDWCQTMRVRISLACGFDHMLCFKYTTPFKRPFHCTKEFQPRKSAWNYLKNIASAHKSSTKYEENVSIVTNFYSKSLNRTFDNSAVLCNAWHERPHFKTVFIRIS